MSCLQCRQVLAVLRGLPFSLGPAYSFFETDLADEDCCLPCVCLGLLFLFSMLIRLPCKQCGYPMDALSGCARERQSGNRGRSEEWRVSVKQYIPSQRQTLPQFLYHGMLFSLVDKDVPKKPRNCHIQLHNL